MEELIKSIADIFFDPVYTTGTVFFLLLLGMIIQLVILLFWKRVPAKIVESYLDDRAGKKKNRFRPIIKYIYSYNGTEYLGQSGWILREASSDSVHMQRIIDENPVGKTSTILVNPLIPSQSTLPYDVQPLHWGLLLGLIVSGLALIIFLEAWT